MTYEGARNKTAEEMQAVFKFLPQVDARRTSFKQVYDEINKADKKYELHTANALWAQGDYPFLGEYFGVIEEYYAGKAANLDFVKNPEGSRITINNLTEDKTNGRIKNLIPIGVIDSFARLVLTNAIYFNGKWLKQFDEKNTSEQDLAK